MLFFYILYEKDLWVVKVLIDLEIRVRRKVFKFDLRLFIEICWWIDEGVNIDLMIIIGSWEVFWFFDILDVE